MAGGKETPRQKMIGMMYLVLTALLALNVSKQIVAAFVTINDKLDYSANIINDKNHGAYAGFEKKFITDKAQGGDGKLVKYWQEKADVVAYETAWIVDFLLKESNRMIETSEQKSWLVEETAVEMTGPEGTQKFYTELKPLSDISGMDNYDIPTNLYIGGNPEKPNADGLEIREKILEYRNKVLAIMGTYEQGGKKYTFEAPETAEGLPEALKTANVDDTAALSNFFKALDLPEEVTQKIHGEEITHPWPSAMFDHAPIVAAAAIFTSLKLDVRNAESLAYDFLLSKVDVQEFDFNKIEVMAFAPASYVNQGDSIPLTVQVAAYDSTAKAKIKYGIDADTANPDAWKDGDNKITLGSGSPGAHKVKGVMYVKQRGVEVPKPWEFSYTVGQPMGVVSLPDLNVLYRGYDNKVQGTASGFPSDRVTLSGSGVTLSKKGEFYIAKPGSGREATISVNGKKEDGSSVNLGSFKFRVLPLPKPTIYLGQVEDGSNIPANVLRASNRLFAKYPPEVPLNVKFSITKWTMNLTGAPREVSGTGGALNSQASSMLKNAKKGNTVSFMCTVKMPDGSTKRKSAAFKVT